MSVKNDVKEQDKGRNISFEENIIENYTQLETSIVNQLSLCNKLHPTTTGTLREDIWLQLFEMIVPKKFVIEHSIFIIDSKGHISKEVDLAIIDNMYTPYIFQYGRLKYVPIEAVAAVVECKSTTIPYKIKEGDGEKVTEVMPGWCESISALRTSRNSVVRMATGLVVKGESYNSKGKSLFESMQKSTRPIRIFCGYKTDLSGGKGTELEKFFDFLLIAKEKGSDKKIEVILSKKDLFKEWYVELNLYGGMELNEAMVDTLNTLSSETHSMEKLKVKQEGKEISLLSFNFQLNQLLMILNNPILFPHFSYAALFNGQPEEDDADEAKDGGNGVKEGKGRGKKET